MAQKTKTWKRGVNGTLEEYVNKIIDAGYNIIQVVNTAVRVIEVSHHDSYNRQEVDEALIIYGSKD